MQQGAVLWEDPASAYSVQQRKQQLTNPAEEMAVQVRCATDYKDDMFVNL
jgi:hypothetical protein